MIALALILAPQSLTGKAAELYDKAKQSRFFAQCEQLHPEISPAAEGRTFTCVRTTVPNPKKWIVTMHGSHGFATDDLALWSKQVVGREVGIITLQWWLGSGERTEDYLTPDQSYAAIVKALEARHVKPGSVMFHGFSRGSANSYAVASIDAGKGAHYFSLNVASSGGVGLNYPPVVAIGAGKYGEMPLKGTKWITSAGGRDPNPERDGIAGMRRAVDWLKTQGAEVLLSIEDPDFGHGALMTNPDNAKRVLDMFLNRRGLRALPSRIQRSSRIEEC